MGSFNFRNSQNKSQKPQTKTTYIKTINSRLSSTAIVPKLIVPAFVSIMAGFFIIGILHSGNAQDNQGLEFSSNTSSQTLTKDTKVVVNEDSNLNVSGNQISQKKVTGEENKLIEDSSNSSVSIKSSVTVNSQSTTNSSLESQKPTVIVNGEEKTLSKTGRYKESCKSENADTNVNIRIDNDSDNSGSTVSINNGGNCMD